MKIPRMPKATRPPMTPAKIMTSGRSAPLRGGPAGYVEADAADGRLDNRGYDDPERHPPYRLCGQVDGILSLPSGEAPRETADPRGRRFALGIEDRGDDLCP